MSRLLRTEGRRRRRLGGSASSSPSPLPLLLVLAVVAHQGAVFVQCEKSSGEDVDCDLFSRASVCPLDIDNVIMIDSKNVESEHQCQYKCFRDKQCEHFTYFAKGEIKKCVLFKECETMENCKSCFSGPAEPSVSNCAPSSKDKKAKDDAFEGPDSSEVEDLQPGDRTTLLILSSGGNSTGTSTTTKKPRKPSRKPKQILDDDDLDEDDEDETAGNDVDEFEVTGIDEGLLTGTGNPRPSGQEDDDEDDDDDDDDDDAFEDDYFDVPGPNGFNDTENVGGGGGRPGFRPGRRPGRRPRPPFFHCVMGGYGPNGPMPTVSHVIPSARRLPRFVPSLPDEFPLGRDGIQGSMIGKNIIVCSPGASKLVRVQPVRRPVLRPIDQFNPFQVQDARVFGIGPINAFDGTSGQDPRFAGSDPRFAGGDPRFAGGDPRFAGGDPRFAGQGQGRFGQGRGLSFDPRFSGGSFGTTGFRRSSFFGRRKRRQTDDGLTDDGGDAEVATRPQTRTVRVPGQCYVYTQSFSIGWVPMGSPMNTFRSGSSITRMGRFLVAVGGRGRSARPLNSIEVLSTRNPNRWRTLNRLTLPRPTYDNCIVAVNKTAVVMTGGVGQESQVVMLDLKDKRFFSMAPLKQPRRKHGCVKATVNGRNGVIVAGGSSDAVPALSSVEFIDLDNGDRLNLGRMRTGRRFPGVMVMANNLVIAGGERTDSRSGRTVIMDDMETLRKSKWRSVRQKLAEPRSRFATIRVPGNFF